MFRSAKVFGIEAGNTRVHVHVWTGQGAGPSSATATGPRPESRRATFYSARYIANAHRRTAHVKAAHVHSEAIQAGVPNGAVSAWSATLYRTDLELISSTLAAVYMPCGLKECARVGWLPRAYAAPLLDSRGRCAQQEAHSSVWGSC